MKKPIHRSSCLTGFLSLMILVNVIIGFYFAAAWLGLYQSEALPAMDDPVQRSHMPGERGLRGRDLALEAVGGVWLRSPRTDILYYQCRRDRELLEFCWPGWLGILVALVLPYWKQMR